MEIKTFLSLSLIKGPLVTKQFVVFKQQGRENNINPPPAPHAHLEEALHILQDVNSTVAEVILLRHTWAGAPHHVFPETPLIPLTHLPLHLQVPKTKHP